MSALELHNVESRKAAVVEKRRQLRNLLRSVTDAYNDLYTEAWALGLEEYSNDAEDIASSLEDIVTLADEQLEDALPSS